MRRTKARIASDRLERGQGREMNETSKNNFSEKKGICMKIFENNVDLLLREAKTRKINELLKD